MTGNFPRTFPPEGGFIYGDKNAGQAVGLSETDIRKMRAKGMLAGAYAKFGHRTIAYHPQRLHQRVAEAFAKSA